MNISKEKTTINLIDNKLLSILRLVLLIAVFFMLIIDFILIFLWVPSMGSSSGKEAARILYLHVPLAWSGFLAFFFVFIGSILYLLKRKISFYQFAFSSAEIGFFLISLALITGMIWGKPVWGKYWIWEPKITTTLILWFIYLAYIMVKNYTPNVSKGMIFSSVIGILGFFNVPIVYYAVQIWGGIHWNPVVGPAAEEGSLSGNMLATFVFSVVVFSIFTVYLVWFRYSLENFEKRLSVIRMFFKQMN